MLHEKDQLHHHLRDNVANDFLLLKIVDGKHLQNFQVFLTFWDNYDPHTLPNNILQVFKNHLEPELHDTIESIKVNCEKLDNCARIPKELANEIGNDWIENLSEVLKNVIL